jgi:hypothetical protein
MFVYSNVMKDEVWMNKEKRYMIQAWSNENTSIILIKLIASADFVFELIHVNDFWYTLAAHQSKCVMKT